MSHQRIVPQGFQLTGIACGIKAPSGKRDLTLIHCPNGAIGAGVYTTNLVHAAPVKIDRERTPADDIRAVVINSGNANACTGDQGMHDALRMTDVAGAAIGAAADKVLVMSTGIIGEHLPMDIIAAGITAAAEQLGKEPDHLTAAAEGILTTDKGTKISGRTASISGKPIQVTGIAKGAGMIGPKMATMLAVVMTDAAIDKNDAQSILEQANDVSFNCVSVDGHMSTNDTCVLLASGTANEAPLKGDDLDHLAALVGQVCIDLAREMANDGEGATHLIEVNVSGCASHDDAHAIAKTIANSPLVKTACTGADPNWGRIVSAAGYAGPEFDPAGVSLSINGASLYENGAPVDFDQATVSKSMRENRETTLELRLSEGRQSARFWTSDLTVEYIRINAEYHT